MIPEAVLRATTLEVWWSEDPNTHAVAVVLQGITEAGQRYLIADHEFGPFDDWRDIANWLWSRMLDLGGMAP